LFRRRLARHSKEAPCVMRLWRISLVAFTSSLAKWASIRRECDSVNTWTTRWRTMPKIAGTSSVERVMVGVECVGCADRSFTTYNATPKRPRRRSKQKGSSKNRSRRRFSKQSRTKRTSPKPLRRKPQRSSLPLQTKTRKSLKREWKDRKKSTFRASRLRRT